jgi:hypothetical protein
MAGLIPARTSFDQLWLIRWWNLGAKLMNLLVDLFFAKILFRRIVGVPNHPAPGCSTQLYCDRTFGRIDALRSCPGGLNPLIRVWSRFVLRLRAVSAAISADPAPIVRDN